MFEPQRPYQEANPEAAVESTKDDEIPVDVADTGEGGFGVCLYLKGLPLLPEFVTVDTHFPGLIHAPPGTYAQTPCPGLPAQYSISSSRPGAAVRGRVSLRVAYFHVRLAAAGHLLVAPAPALTPRASLPPISLPPCTSSPPVMGTVLFCDRRRFNASGLKRQFRVSVR